MYNILKSINEKNTIKRFIDGLNDQRIRIIINPKSFFTFKDAIHTAVEELLTDQSMTSTNEKEVEKKQFFLESTIITTEVSEIAIIRIFHAAEEIIPKLAILQ